MSTWSVNLITAFGRGEHLAQALLDQGFAVRVFDFTDAFAPTYHRGAGPFPLAAAAEDLPPEAERLSRGLALWLEGGPIELGGPLAEFFSHRPDVKALRGGVGVAAYTQDWLRRFVRVWASPQQIEAWDVDDRAAAFPTNVDLYRLPNKYIPFDRFRRAGNPFVVAQKLVSLRLVGPRLTEIVVEAGQAMAFGAEQWAWCLSAAETQVLNPELTRELFPRGMEEPTWFWLSFKVGAAHGPWMEGLPAEVCLIGDVCLPLDRDNLVVLSREDRDSFRAWMKVPRATAESAERRGDLARDLEKRLGARLGLAKWTVDAADWRICPHSPVYSGDERRALDPRWRNWDWIAPETLPRLDGGARLRREAESVKRIAQWRDDQLKKQGASSDQSLHAP